MCRGEKYKTDVSYLLGTGVLNESDLDSLIGDDVVNKGLSREEMAMLVTKVLGKDKEPVNAADFILCRCGSWYYNWFQ